MLNKKLSLSSLSTSLSTSLSKDKKYLIKQQMKNILHWAKDADYCDVRWVCINQYHQSCYNQNLEADEHLTDEGLAIRVMIKGSWGFSCTPYYLDENIVKGCTQEAISIAKAGITANLVPHQLSPKEAFQENWHYPETRPFQPQLHLAEIQDLLLECNQKMKNFSSSIKVASSLFRHKRTLWLYCDSEGSELEQSWMRTGAGVQATAVAHGDVQTRSFNTRHSLAGGMEHINRQQLLLAAERVAEESIMLTAAEEVAPQSTDLIIGTDQLALQIHESVGHPNELDRVLGWEANFAGTSFNLIGHRGKLQYGSPLVNFVADPLLPGGTGTRAYDDEGVKGERWFIVKNGLFQDYYTSRDTSLALGEGESSRGCVRADSWSSFPIIRIPNVSLQAGDWKLEDLVADTENGLYLDTNRSWSIDQRRDQFQFGVEMAYEIKQGKKGRLLKNVVYRGRTIPFWNSCDAICNHEDYRIFGEIYCGKGQPMQTMEMSHGCAPARFRQVEVRPS